MRTIKSCFFFFLLWLACACCLVIALFAVAPTYRQLWLPAGVSDPHLEQVAGDSYAITSAGYYYHKPQDSWKKVELPSPVERPVWGLASSYELLIYVPDGILYDQLNRDPQILPPPPLSQPLTALGGASACTTSRGMDFELFAASPTELALYNENSETWKAFPLQAEQTTLVSAGYCWLAYLTPSGSLNTIYLETAGYADQAGLAIHEHAADLSRIGEVAEIVSSSHSLYLLSRSGSVWQAASLSEAGIQWEQLPAPPRLTGPHLIAGVAGTSFGGPEHAEKIVDLWLSGGEGIYRLDRVKGTWQKFGSIYWKRPDALSSVASDGEMSGADLSRLALIDGRLYRQHPIFGGLAFQLIIIGIPGAALLAIFVALGIWWIVKLLRRLRKMVIARAKPEAI